MTKLQIQSKAAFTIVGLLGLLASNASACIDQRGSAGTAASGLSIPSLLSPTEPSLPEPQNSLSDGQAQSEDQFNHHRSSIVGLWVARFYKRDTNEQIDVALAQFFADGNEIENDIAVPPRVQNTCYGLWESSGNGVVGLKHIGWDFTNDVFDGTVLEAATVRLSRDGDSFAGKFTLDQRDLFGNIIPSLHADGVIKGVRFKFSDNVFTIAPH